MTELNSQQLAFILDIKKEDARAKMCNAWEKAKGIAKDSDKMKFEKVHGAKWSDKGRIEDQYPATMPIEILAIELNMPSLQIMVDDIVLNYLNRPASKKYILVDFPEKLIKKTEDAGEKFPVRIDIPPALRSMLPEHVKAKIYDYWSGFKTANYQPRFNVPANG